MISYTKTLQTKGQEISYFIKEDEYSIPVRYESNFEKCLEIATEETYIDTVHVPWFDYTCDLYGIEEDM